MIQTTKLSFGQAKCMAKSGKMIAREKWLAESMFVFLSPEINANQYTLIPQEVKDKISKHCTVSEMLLIHVDSSIYIYIPSDEDINTADWLIKQ